MSDTIRLVQELIEKGELTEEDAVHVAAFEKFLKEGNWIDDDGKRKYLVSKRGWEYATGKITAKEYLDGD